MTVSIQLLHASWLLLSRVLHNDEEIIFICVCAFVFIYKHVPYNHSKHLTIIVELTVLIRGFTVRLCVCVVGTWSDHNLMLACSDSEKG